jgi:hypothetical protein
MGLNVFPDLASNIDIKKIVKRVWNNKSIKEVKSPRGGKIDCETRDECISFEEFENIMTQIAFRAFGGDPKCTIQTMISQLYKHIKDPALLSYGVKITLRKWLL